MEIITHETSKWDDPQQDKTFWADFNKGSQFIPLHGASTKVFEYDPKTYPLADLIVELLVEKSFIDRKKADDLDSLADLHRILPPKAMALDDGELNLVSRSFYEQGEAFGCIYQRFIKEVVTDQVTRGDCLFQSTPTIRFHFPNQQGFRWLPRYHNDVMLGHPPQEINIWIPLCRALGSASMRLAPLSPSLDLLRSVDNDFEAFAHGVQVDPSLQARCHEVSSPVELDYGQFVAFDSRCLHATQYNDTDRTRVSLDFRVLPIEDYATVTLPYRGTGRLRMPFTLGAYYHDVTARLADT